MSENPSKVTEFNTTSNEKYEKVILDTLTKY